MSDYILRDVAIIEFMDNDIDHIQAPNGKEAVQILSDIPTADVVQVDAIIQFIETRKQLHSSPVWYEFGIVKELDEVKRFIEKMQTEEDNEG